MAHARDLDRTGALLYERHCQSCHGPSGEGSKRVPAILGRATLSESRFRTAQELWDYVAANMPKDSPGGLDITQYWEIVTFMVASTGRRKIPDERLSESNAGTVRLRGE
jgi:cytochrome c